MENGKISEIAKMHQIKDSYNVEKHGAVVAIHLYLGGEYDVTPMADLAFAFGGAAAGVRWDCINEREVYLPGINSYTVVYDDRFRGRDFDSYVKPVLD